jgi:hypothetical protein
LQWTILSFVYPRMVLSLIKLSQTRLLGSFSMSWISSEVLVNTGLTYSKAELPSLYLSLLLFGKDGSSLYVSFQVFQLSFALVYFLQLLSTQEQERLPKLTSNQVDWQLRPSMPSNWSMPIVTSTLKRKTMSVDSKTTRPCWRGK